MNNYYVTLECKTKRTFIVRATTPGEAEELARHLLVKTINNTEELGLFEWLQNRTIKITKE